MLQQTASLALVWSLDGPGLPFGWLLVVLVALPVAVAVFFGAMAFRRATPLVFRCAACARTFDRKPWRRFPTACPHCGARDWNATTPR